METLFTEGELMQPHNDFHHGQYDKVLAFDIDSVDGAAALPARILRMRAQIATGQSAAVLEEVQDEADQSADLAAVQALARWTSGTATAEATEQAEQLAADHGDNATVQVLAGTVLHASGRSDEALALLAQHDGSLEAVALLTHIYLEQNRTDKALAEVQAARKWAQDSLLVNLAESWVGLRLGGDRYQQAFYEFEDMPVCQAVAELHLARLPEAEAALQQVRTDHPNDIQALANSIVLNILAGKDAQESTAQLKSLDPDHPFLAGLKEKSDLFDQAARKYSS